MNSGFVSTRNWFAVSTGRFCGHRFGKLCPQEIGLPYPPEGFVNTESGIWVHKKLVCRVHLRVLWTQILEFVSTTGIHTMNIMKSDPMRNGNSVLAAWLVLACG